MTDQAPPAAPNSPAGGIWAVAAPYLIQAAGAAVVAALSVGTTLGVQTYRSVASKPIIQAADPPIRVAQVQPTPIAICDVSPIAAELRSWREEWKSRVMVPEPTPKPRAALPRPRNEPYSVLTWIKP
jgi:hypothetical protein